MSRRPGETRITGGALRRRPLAVPPGVRPTASRVREALFSIWRNRISGARFLDLFAGSGAVGLEALSRGAREVVLIEASRRAAAVAEANAARLAQGGVTVLRAELFEGLAKLSDARFDLVFADPPYDFVGYEDVITGVAPLLTPAGELAVEHSVRKTLPSVAGELSLDNERIYGESSLAIYRLGGAE